jgi:hypothetical protein
VGYNHHDKIIFQKAPRQASGLDIRRKPAYAGFHAFADETEEQGVQMDKRRSATNQEPRKTFVPLRPRPDNFYASLRFTSSARSRQVARPTETWPQSLNRAASAVAAASMSETYIKQFVMPDLIRHPALSRILPE